MQLSPELTREVKQMLQIGNAIGAIKRVREVTGADLREAKFAVDGMLLSSGSQTGGSQSGGSDMGGTVSNSLSAEGHREILQLLVDGQAVEAAKRVMERTGLNLSHAKVVVDRMKLSVNGAGYRKNASLSPAKPAGGDFTSVSRMAAQGGRVPVRSAAPVMVRLFLWLGLGLLAAAYVMHARHESFAKRAREVQGVVVALDRSSGSGSTPVVRYITPEGPREVTGLVSSSPAAYDKGQKVSVLYDRSSGEARINAGLERWFFVALLGGLGGVFVIVSRVVGFFTKLANR
jgi:ribosomal protein L7/L12